MNKRKAAVVDHARALFLEKGIQQTSIQDIIERAQISKGTFYNYFASKNECVTAILQKTREEIDFNRIQLQIGKNHNDIDVLIEQIVLMYHVNAKQGLSGLFEEIMHSSEDELKRKVLHFRIIEIDWLGKRLIDVFGESVSSYHDEVAVLFYGMFHHLHFISKQTSRQPISLERITKSVFHHIAEIIKHIAHDGVAVLEHDSLDRFKQQLEINKVMNKEDILLQLKQLMLHQNVSANQLELMEAITAELEHEYPKKAVVEALLRAMFETYRYTEQYMEMKDVVGMIWEWLSCHNQKQ